jgi:hypothetical protein
VGEEEQPGEDLTQLGAPAASVAADLRRLRIVAGLAGAVVVGTLGTWATALFITISGLDTGDGKVVAVVGAIALCVTLAAVFRGKPRPRVAMTLAGIAGLITAAICIYDVSQLSQETDWFGESVQISSAGWGLWLSLLASVGLAGYSAFAFVQARRAGAD